MPTSGVVTHMSTSNIAPMNTFSAVLEVLRGAPPTYSLIGQTPVLLGDPGLSPVGADVRIPVHSGDVLGYSTTTGAYCARSTGVATDQIAVTSMNPMYVADGSPITYSSSAPNYVPNVAATLEPDADGDGYGDDSQDSCPADPAIHSGSCTTDVALTQTASPTTAQVGDLVPLTLTATNLAGATAAITVTDVLPAGMTAVAAGGGTCTIGATVTCQIGSLAVGASTTVIVVARATAVGAQTAAGTVSSPLVDPTPGNNAASATVTVSPATVIPPPTPLDRCVVPKLTKQPLAVAKLLLKAAHCGVGKVTTAKAKKSLRHAKILRVTKQGAAAGTPLPVNTTVTLTVAKSKH